MTSLLDHPPRECPEKQMRQQHEPKKIKQIRNRPVPPASSQLTDQLQPAALPASQLRDQLLALADSQYRQFIAGLIPGAGTILGIRMPELRRLARQLAQGDWRNYLATATADTHEEALLQGLVIGQAKMTAAERLERIAAFVPKISNWAICDSFASALHFTRQNQAIVWDFIQSCLFSSQEYTVRFGIVMLLQFYLDNAYIDRSLAALASIGHPGYYVKMAIAWTVATSFDKQPGPTGAWLRTPVLDDSTFNKALQKIAESRRIDPASKAEIRRLRRKPPIQP